MDPCLSLRADSVRLKIKDQFVVQNKYTYIATDRGFKITFTDLKQIPNINKGDSIVLSYTAYLNENAAPKISKRGFENKVRVNFSNDPQNESKGQSPWDCVVCYTYQLNGLKSNEKNVKLKGATFKMYRDAAMRDQVKMKKTNSGYVVTDGQSEDIVSNENGEFEIYGLDQGTYYLKETKAPAGYQLLQKPIELTISPKFVENRNNYRSNGDGLLKLEASSFNTPLNVSQSDAIIGLKVINKTGTKLPVTGSFGTVLCVVTGAGIMVYVCKKKREE